MVMGGVQLIRTDRDEILRLRNLEVVMVRRTMWSMGGIDELRRTVGDIPTSALNLPFKLRNSYLKLLAKLVARRR